MVSKISEIEKKLLVDRFLASDKTKAEFAREYDLPFSTMCHYIKAFAPDEIRPRFTDEQKAKIVSEFLKSDLTQEAFAKRQKIAVITLSIWCKKFAPGQKRTNRRKEKLLDEYLASDLTLKKFAELKGLVVQTMKIWFRECDPGAERRKIKNERTGHASKGRSKAEKIALAREYLSSGLSVIKFAESKGLKPIYIYKCLYLRDAETL